MHMFEHPKGEARARREVKNRKTVGVWLPPRASTVEGISVAQFGAQIGITPIALIDQLAKIGIVKNLDTDALTEQERLRFQEYLRSKRTDAIPLQPMSVYLAHPEREELSRLIPSLNNPSKWMDGWRWSSLTASRRADLRRLVSDDFPELIRAYDWLVLLGAGYNSSKHLDTAEDAITTAHKVTTARHIPPFKGGMGEGKPVPKSPELLAFEEELHRAEMESESQGRLVTHNENPPHNQSAYKPSGVAKPKASAISTTQYLRDPAVKEWVLKEAMGICECCRNPAPFCFPDGTPYLEVHHVIPLSDGGPDTVSNTVALCPNCHREMHFGAHANAKSDQIYARLQRLTRK